jgi:hypothetical protein
MSITTDLSSRAIEHSVIAVAVAMRICCPARLPSPKKSPGPNTAITASLPAFNTAVNLTLPFWILKDGIRRIALGEDHAALVEGRDGPSLANGKLGGRSRRFCGIGRTGPAGPRRTRPP